MVLYLTKKIGKTYKIWSQVHFNKELLSSSDRRLYFKNENKNVET